MESSIFASAEGNIGASDLPLVFVQSGDSVVEVVCCCELYDCTDLDYAQRRHQLGHLIEKWRLCEISVGIVVLSALAECGPWPVASSLGRGRMWCGSQLLRKIFADERAPVPSPASLDVSELRKCTNGFAQSVSTDPHASGKLTFRWEPLTGSYFATFDY